MQDNNSTGASGASMHKVHAVEPCSPMCALPSPSIDSSWELVRNAGSQVPTHQNLPFNQIPR